MTLTKLKLQPIDVLSIDALSQLIINFEILQLDTLITSARVVIYQWDNINLWTSIYEVTQKVTGTSIILSQINNYLNNNQKYLLRLYYSADDIFIESDYVETVFHTITAPILNVTLDNQYHLIPTHSYELNPFNNHVLSIDYIQAQNDMLINYYYELWKDAELRWTSDLFAPISLIPNHGKIQLSTLTLDQVFNANDFTIQIKHHSNNFTETFIIPISYNNNGSIDIKNMVDIVEYIVNTINNTTDYLVTYETLTDSYVISIQTFTQSLGYDINILGLSNNCYTTLSSSIEWPICDLYNLEMDATFNLKLHIKTNSGYIQTYNYYLNTNLNYETLPDVQCNFNTINNYHQGAIDIVIDNWLTNLPITSFKIEKRILPINRTDTFFAIKTNITTNNMLATWMTVAEFEYDNVNNYQFTDYLVQNNSTYEYRLLILYNGLYYQINTNMIKVQFDGLFITSIEDYHNVHLLYNAQSGDLFEQQNGKVLSFLDNGFPDIWYSLGSYKTGSVSSSIIYNTNTQPDIVNESQYRESIVSFLLNHHMKIIRTDKGHLLLATITDAVTEKIDRNFMNIGDIQFHFVEIDEITNATLSKYNLIYNNSFFITELPILDLTKFNIIS